MVEFHMAQARGQAPEQRISRLHLCSRRDILIMIFLNCFAAMVALRFKRRALCGRGLGSAALWESLRDAWQTGCPW